MEKSWKIIVEKEGAPWDPQLCSQQAYYAPVSHARLSSRNPHT